MQRVSTRTLVLMLELLLAVVALQYLMMAEPAQAGAVWLADDVAGAPSTEVCVGASVATVPALGTEVNGTTEP